ncbi:hypothetical protein CICLE_v10007186mg [Citrus x clementina]|uniref:GEX2 N-terminal Ig-like domain-containing protein n=1 Tax=Citrus clementina TaxID=85681 RepID=V4S7A3_CITCL|nr:hypothetical protein CICLE_v10007186mg [Citrus x clementina]
MAVQSHLFILISLLASTLSSASAAELASNPSPKFAFSWLDDNNTFQAGDTATIRIKVLGNFDSRGDASLGKSAFKPTLTVNGKIGNTSYISGVLLETGEDTSNWRILFIPISVGLFNTIIKDDPFEVLDSSLHFKVEPGRLNPSVCVASWMGLINEFEAGNKARIMILPKDAFGNNVTSTSEELSSFNFTVSALYANGSALTPNITNMGLNEVGYIIIEFILMKAGNFSLHVEAGNQTLNGSPLPFKVNPGPVDVSNCVAKWKYEVAAWQIFSKMEIFIHQLDQYGNLVPGFYAFDADVVEKETNLSIPVADLQFEEVAPGVQLFSYTIEESGNFLLTISDEKHNKSVSNMPYTYTVFVGYCNGSSSVVNGSGLNDSVAGETAHFSVYLNDMFQYPYPVEVERLQVQIVTEIDSSTVWPSISPTQIYNVQASAFDVTYTPEKSGIYKILVLCANIALNGGHPFTKEVTASDVNMTLSGVVKFTPKVAKLITHEVVVQLLDSYSNPVLSQQSGLKLEITSMNSSGFSSWMFVDNNDGSYSGHYLAMDVGTYEMCVSYDGTNFSLCPFLVNVYSSQYFPKAYDDKVSVWEDESIALDALANDYFAGNNASIIEFSKPVRGSLLQYGRMFRYTPFKDYIGNDSFSYTISDVNGNLATAAVNISVLSIPPQFVSFPSQLQATEDMISPRFGGFLGFEIRYSDMLENISVSLSARSGTVLLSSMMMQFWQPMSSGLSVRIGDGYQKELIIEGSVEIISMALQSIQYLGNENFYGEDTIRVSARNKNGKNDLAVPVFVDPVNDPPFIQVPKYIVLKSDADESQIFDRETNKFNFSIGDPDAFNYPGMLNSIFLFNSLQLLLTLLYVSGGTSRFLVTFSMEVNDGLLVTCLPAELINSTELKLKTSFQWEPLQTYVTISKHFTVKASGVRFRGTVNDCNSIMQQLFYQSGEGDDVLKVKLNDMGHYGCRPDCTEKISLPLFAEATVNLIRRRPMSSVLAHTLGAGVVIEFFMVFFLGVLLLFFTCKCAFLLVNERRSHDDTTYFTGCCSTSFMLAGQASNFRQW